MGQMKHMLMARAERIWDFISEDIEGEEKFLGRNLTWDEAWKIATDVRSCEMLDQGAVEDDELQEGLVETLHWMRR